MVPSILLTFTPLTLPEGIATPTSAHQITKTPIKSSWCPKMAHQQPAPHERAMKSLDGMRDDSMEDVFLQDGLCPTIAEHATQCNTLFHRYMAVPQILPDPTVMDDQLARFTLWTSNMDVYAPPNVSLDYRLRFSPTVVEIIHQLLDVIVDTLTSCKDWRART